MATGTSRLRSPGSMNAAYLAGFLRREDEKLEAAQVRRIIVAQDEKCRNVEF